MFDFDKVPDRRKTNSSKWDGMEKAYGVSSDDGIAMSLADMDFPSPPAVNATLRNLVDHGVQGYFGDDRAYRAAVAGWMSRRHDWQIRTDWILSSYGVVTALGLALQAFSAPGDGVIVFSPVYAEFAHIIKANNRRVVESRLVQQDGLYRMDLDALADRLDGSEKVVILCSPHNPGGRVWSREELTALADFCVTHDLMLFSDEVHHDLIYPGNTHTVTANAAPHILDRLITMSAASKTFNIAGLKTSQVIVPDPDLRARMAAVQAAAGIGYNRYGAMATTAAYAHGDDWLDALLAYLDNNRRTFEQRINAIPGLRAMPMQATFLSWVDFNGTGMTDEEIHQRVLKQARIAANLGPTFGDGGDGFMRFNIGTNRARISDALERLDHAFEDLQ